MTRYMVIHTPTEELEEHTNPPTRLQEMAQKLGKDGSVPQWVTTFSPDLNDDRIISIWEAPDADTVRAALADFGFLDHLEPKVFGVREWGPQDVLDAAEDDEEIS